MSGTDRFDTASAADVLGAVLLAPGGSQTALGAFADVPGVRHDPGVVGRRLRRGTPASLRVGEWEFVVDATQTAGLLVRHVVRDVVLLTETPPPAAAARRLAGELLSSAQQHGSDADIATQSALFGLSAVVGR